MEAAEHTTNTVVKALLFTDLVGSTDLKRRLGDAAGAEVISKHDGVARERVAKFGGSDLKDTGDGFLAAFDVPSNAVLCALSFQPPNSATRAAAGSSREVHRDCRSLSPLTVASPPSTSTKAKSPGKSLTATDPKTTPPSPTST